MREIAALLVLLVGIGAGWIALRADADDPDRRGLVVGVVDGDTVDVRVLATRERVRVLGIELPGERDLGLELVKRGFARVFVVGRPFKRPESYRKAESVGRALLVTGEPLFPRGPLLRGRRLGFVVIREPATLGVA
jgi:endonuclease YncB( thermonuclease family)